MPLLKKKPFKKRDPPPGLQPDDEVFFCEATKEVFKDYESFFQRTILCNSLVWSCSVTGKSNLTYDEAVESEAKARKRLGDIPKPLKRGLLWLADHTCRGRINDVVDDVYVFANARFFIGEIVEGIINDQWCDCKVLKVIPPTQEEIDKDAEEEREEEEKAAKEGSPSKKKPKKTFFPPDHLFKYELQEVEPDNPDDNPVLTIPADDIRREKGTFTREKNLLFLKNILDLESNGTLVLNQDIRQKYKLSDMKFEDIFAGPEPVFEVTKRGKSGPPGRKAQGTLDGWVTGKSSSSSKGQSKDQNKVKKQSPAEIEAEMRRMKEQNQRFKEEMKQRAEEAKKQKMEEKAKEKERKKEETRLVRELLTEWKKPREDLECEDLKPLPKTLPVYCKIPNHLFGDFLSLLEFFHSFAGVLETNDTFSHGITFKILEKALEQSHDPKGSGFYEILRFMLQALFDLQQEEDEEVRLDAKNLANVNVHDLDKNILGKDEDIANQIRSATQMARWCMKHQGQPIKALHMDEHSISEILRLHLESSGAYRSDRSLLWLYQQRGGYKLSDDPGLQFRMDEPQILEALSTHTVYELSLDDKMKILHCLKLQIMSYATVRDEIDEKFNELFEAKSELRNHQISENKRQKQFEEAEKAKRREEKIQKKEEELKEKENTEQKASEKQTDRQKEAVIAQKEKEEKDRLRKEEIARSIAYDAERELMNRVAELRHKAGPHCLGRDRAYRRFWMLESLPGLYVEHDDEFVGECLPNPTIVDPDAQPMDEAQALLKVRQMLDGPKLEPKAEGQGSDKENDNLEENTKTYSKKSNVLNSQQKVLSAKNGTLEIASTSKPEINGEVVTVNGVVNEIKSELKEINPEPMMIDNIKPEVVLDTNPLKPEMWGICLADMDNCTVHSTILPKTHWSYISSVEDFDKLIESLNPRGIREGDLKEKLVSERESITKHLKKFEEDLEDRLQLEETKMSKTESEDISAILDLAMRDQVLEIEERIFFGTLGSLKIRDRQAWQRAISEGGYDKQCETLTWGGKSMMNTPYESRMVSASASRETSRPGSPDRDSGNSFVKRQNEKIRGLASAILQVAQMLDPKYFKSPLGEDEKDKKKRLKEEEKRKKEADDTNTEAEPVKAQEILTPLQEWENSLMSSTSYAQLFVHLTTLDSSIIWSKSILNTKCRLCRRKCDPDKMLLCDGCDRGHHMYCLKPKLSKIPSGDWYCHDCKPKERVKSPKKKSRQVFSTEEREEEQDEDMDTTEANESDNDEDAAEENSSDENNSEEDEEKDEETPPRRTKKSKRSVEPAPKKAKKSALQKKGLSQFLGKRKSAAEASEKIKTFVGAEIEGHSSGSEECQNSKADKKAESSASGERQSSRLRTRTSKSQINMESKAAKLKEQRLSSDDFMAFKVSKSRCKRRRGAGIDDELLTMYNPSALEDLLNNMMKHKDGWPFDRPITKADAPDYFEIIQKPMDLGTVRSTLLQMKYSCNQEVLQDIRVVFANCYLYNREDAEEYQCAKRLEKYFEKEAKKLGLLEEEDFEDENQPLSKKARRTL